MEIDVTPELEVLDMENIEALKLYTDLGFVESHSAVWKLFPWN